MNSFRFLIKRVSKARVNWEVSPFCERFENQIQKAIYISPTFSILRNTKTGWPTGGKNSFFEFTMDYKMND